MHLLDRRILVFTGLAGVVGGLGTVALESSCDVECVADDRPAVVVRVFERAGSTIRPVTASSVTYSFRGVDEDGDAITDALAVPPIEHDGECTDDSCTRWQLGEHDGTFDIAIQACGDTVLREVEVPLAADGCTPQTQYVDAEVDCSVSALRDRAPVVCDTTARPALMIYVGILRDDYVAPVLVDEVWYEHEGRTAPARCIAGQSADDGCAMWAAGWEQPGTFVVSTEWCDTIVSETVDVGMTPDGCHVDTAFVMLHASTRGCVTNEAEPPTEPPLEGADALVGDPPSAPPSVFDDLRIEPPTGDPFGPRLQHG